LVGVFVEKREREAVETCGGTKSAEKALTAEEFR